MKKQLDNAIKRLNKKYPKLEVQKYTLYNGAFLFFAVPKGFKGMPMDPYYLVDLEEGIVGPFAPAFDFEGFAKAADNFKEI